MNPFKISKGRFFRTFLLERVQRCLLGGTSRGNTLSMDDYKTWDKLPFRPINTCMISGINSIFIVGCFAKFVFICFLLSSS